MDEFMDAVVKYSKKFDGYPRELDGYTESEQLRIINECLELGLSVYDLGYIIRQDNDYDL